MNNPLEPGIYFDLPEEVYRADPAISRSDILNFMISPLTFWWESPMNPAYEKEDMTPAKRKGLARHSYILEPKNFHAQYAVQPDLSDYEGALVTIPHLKEYTKKHTLKTSGNKDELINRIRGSNLKPVIWDEVVEDFRIKNDGKVFLTKEEMQKLEFARKMFYLHPEAKATLQGGYPEVSLFWRDEKTGLMLKCRVDYMKPAVLDDLKTFSNPQDLELNKTICRAIQYGKHYLQARLYLAGWESLKTLLVKNKAIISGEVEKSFIEDYKAAKTCGFEFIFQQSDGPWEVRIKEFVKNSYEGATPNLYWTQAQDDLRSALEGIKRYLDYYGKEPWVELNYQRTTLDDTELPGIIYQ